MAPAAAPNRSALTSGQIDAPFGRLGVLSKEQRGVADGADAEATSLVRDLAAEGWSLVALRSEEADFHEFMRSQLLLELSEESGREASFAEF